MSARCFLTLMIVATILVALPSTASATSFPSLPSGGTQAYLADANGDPQNGSYTSTGSLTITGAVSIACNTSWDTDYFDDGTAEVTAFTASSCAMAGFPSCTTSVTPTNQPWRTRVYWDGARFRSYKLIEYHVFVMGSCPVPSGAYTSSGAVSPEVSISGTTHTTTFGSGSGSGSVSGPLGSATIDGSLTGTVPSGSQYVF